MFPRISVSFIVIVLGSWMFWFFVPFLCLLVRPIISSTNAVIVKNKCISINILLWCVGGSNPQKMLLGVTKF